MKLPLAYPPIRRMSKSLLVSICSRQLRELKVLRREVAAASRAQPRPSAPAAERDAMRTKLRADIEAAKQKHAEIAAQQAAEKPEQDRKRVEAEAQIRKERLAHENEYQKKWYAAHPGKRKGT